jgi:inward rectifier potassium channel
VAENNPFRDGRFNFRIEGAPRSPINDIYAYLLRESWGRLLLWSALGYTLGNMVFAVLYILGGDCITGAKPGHFGDAFYFSVQTMSTIGYGTMSPKTPFAHILVTIESFLGIILVAVGTGLVFAKFSRPEARVLFANVATIRKRNGIPCLQFRVVSERNRQVMAAKMKAFALVQETTAEGQQMARMRSLKLETEELPLFTLTWTGIHQLDASSPLHGLTEENAAERTRFILVRMSGTDHTFLQEVHAVQMYEAEDLRFGHDFADVIERLPDESIVLHHSTVHDTEAVD